MSNRIEMFGCPIDTLTLVETEDKIDNAISNKQQLTHAPVNSALLVYMQKDKILRDSIISCDIINMDGQFATWACGFLGKPIPEKIPATDLMQNLISNAKSKGHTIFFLGAKEDVVKEVVNKYSSLYGDEIIAGYRNGYFKDDEEEEIAKQIANSGADMLFVAITSPKKEIFLNKYKDILNIPFTMGVGGAFDVVAGKTKRAPKWMQDSGFEWLYRLIQEPKRMLKRNVHTGSVMIYMVLKEKLIKILKG
jgi:N-acetylglucosaminyldiphosphoundecaprenol N-acetyl-beta-D-mannosaminyltransferase